MESLTGLINFLIYEILLHFGTPIKALMAIGMIFFASKLLGDLASNAGSATRSMAKKK